MTVAQTVTTTTHQGFWLKLALAICVCAIPLLVILAFMVKIGESPLIGEALARQRVDSDVIYLPGLVNRQFEYKIARAAELKPEVLVLGSSRVHQIRASFFAPISAYNAGNTVGNFIEAKAFLSNLVEQHRPRVVIFNIDPYMFSAKPFDQDVTKRAYANAMQSTQYLLNDWSAALDRLRDKRSEARKAYDRGMRDPFTKRPALGLLAATSGHGFRVDGSLQHTLIVQMKDAKLDSYIRKEIAKFNEGAAVRRNVPIPHPVRQLTDDRWSELAALKKFCDDNGISLVLMTLPIDTVYYKISMESPAVGSLLYPLFFTPETASLLRSTVGPYFNFSQNFDPANPYIEMLDVSHPTEKACARAVLGMVRDPQTKHLFSRIDAGALERRVSTMNTYLNDR